MRCLTLSRNHRLVAVLLVAVVFLAACTNTEDNGNREEAVKNREQQLSLAETKYPAPQPKNFPIRHALVKYTERQDLEKHPWYTYIMGMNGNYVGYFVGQTYPISTCDFLSSTEKIVWDGGGGNMVLTAPSYDGIYYGGGGASAACNALFFFDQETDAMLTFSVPMWFTSDRPLKLDVPRLESAEDMVNAAATANGTTEAP